jgi:dihydroorotase
LDDIRVKYPMLKISVEHVSSADMVSWVLDQPAHVGAGITVHHLYVTADDLNGYSKRSGGLICVDDGGFKPGAKDPLDRCAVQWAALSGNPKFWYGGDNAAHPGRKKHCTRGMCGAFNAIPALSLVLSLFEKSGKIEGAEKFLAESGALFYGYELNQGTATFVREEWVVAEEYPVSGLDDVLISFYAKEKMEWRYISPC